jgi:Tol biopolymer transport system component
VNSGSDGKVWARLKLAVVTGAWLSLAGCGAAATDAAPAAGKEWKALSFIRFNTINASLSTWQLGVVNADGSGLRFLTDTSWELEGAAFSPDGQRIIFAGGANLNGSDSITRANHPYGLWSINRDGSSLARLASPALPRFPRWSPDGRQIVFEATLGDDIWIENSDGTSPRQLTNTADTDIDPVISPDGSQIAFTRSNGAQSRWAVFVMNSDGSNVRRLTPYDIYNMSASWSADGKRIAFGHLGGDGTFLSVVNVDGTGLTPLSPQVRDALFSEFRPDGQAIAYATPIFNGSGLVTLDFATGQRVTVTPAQPNLFDSDPSWGRTR